MGGGEGAEVVESGVVCEPMGGEVMRSLGDPDCTPSETRVFEVVLDTGAGGSVIDELVLHASDTVWSGDCEVGYSQ